MKKFVIFSLIEDEALVRGISKEFTSLEKEIII